MIEQPRDVSVGAVLDARADHRRVRLVHAAVHQEVVIVLVDGRDTQRARCCRLFDAVEFAHAPDNVTEKHDEHDCNGRVDQRSVSRKCTQLHLVIDYAEHRGCQRLLRFLFGGRRLGRLSTPAFSSTLIARVGRRRR